ncbi:hypothetical protein NOGI109294_26540 [Nocardiopsis gilva]
MARLLAGRISGSRSGHSEDNAPETATRMLDTHLVMRATA